MTKQLLQKYVPILPGVPDRAGFVADRRDMAKDSVVRAFKALTDLLASWKRRS